jgi:hypothetical protein
MKDRGESMLASGARGDGKGEKKIVYEKSD